MAQFPAKLLAVLPELDPESASLVILNNLSGLLPGERLALRSQLQRNSSSLAACLSGFRTHQDSGRLLSALRAILSESGPNNPDGDMVSFSSGPSDSAKTRKACIEVDEEFRGQRLLHTESRFRLVIDGEKENCRIKGKPTSADNATEEKRPIFTQISNFSAKAEEAGTSFCCTCQSDNYRTTGHFAAALVDSPVFRGGGKDSGSPEEERGEGSDPPTFAAADSATDLVSTVETEELFKRYLTEQRREESAARNPILELSYSTLLRYVDCGAALEQFSKVKQIGKSAFVAKMRSAAFAASGRESDAGKLRLVFDALSGRSKFQASVLVDSLLGGVVLFCKGTCEDKIRAALKHMSASSFSDRKVRFPALRCLLASVFRIVTRFLPNSTRAAQVSLSELAGLTAAQCFEDNYAPPGGCIEVPDLVRWFSAQAISLVPSSSRQASSQSARTKHNIAMRKPMRAPTNPAMMHCEMERAMYGTMGETESNSVLGERLDTGMSTERKVVRTCQHSRKNSALGRGGAKEI